MLWYREIKTRGVIDVAKKKDEAERHGMKKSEDVE
jgi:hypothetical protein